MTGIKLGCLILIHQKPKFNLDTLLKVPFWLPDPDGWSHQFERAGDERGYTDFRTIFNHFYSKADFNKLYGYGCYCSNIGSGTGQRQTSGRIGSEMSADPIDEKDALCKSWSMCVRCAQHDFGDQCSTSVNYKYRLGWASDKNDGNLIRFYNLDTLNILIPSASEIKTCLITRSIRHKLK